MLPNYDTLMLLATASALFIALGGGIRSFHQFKTRTQDRLEALENRLNKFQHESHEEHLKVEGKLDALSADVRALTSSISKIEGYIKGLESAVSK